MHTHHDAPRGNDRPRAVRLAGERRPGDLRPGAGVDLHRSRLRLARSLRARQRPRRAAIGTRPRSRVPTASSNGTAYRFRLRPGIRYSDGTLVRASDFRRALERDFRLRSPGTSYFTSIVGATACLRRPTSCNLTTGVATDDADGTVTFQLTSPDPDFLFKLTDFGFSAPVPPNTPNRDLKYQPVPGTGPYRIERASSTEVRLVRNPLP